MKSKRHNLITIIKNDFLLYGKVHLILLIAIILSANFTIITVYKTRLLIAQEEKEFILKKKNAEWRKLIIEKNALSIYALKK